MINVVSENSEPRGMSRSKWTSETTRGTHATIVIDARPSNVASNVVYEYQRKMILTWMNPMPTHHNGLI